MPVLNKPNQKARYVLSLIDNKEYCKSTGKFNLHLKEHGLTEEEYVQKYEGGQPLICKACGTRHLFDKGTWLWSQTCHVRKCELSSWKISAQSMDKEVHGKKSSVWRQDKEKVANADAARHKANQHVGEDGLTGYERTKMKREQILQERTGNKFNAGWDKMRETWKNASEEHRKAHGEKIKDGVLEKHGVEYIMQVPEILEKQKRTLNRPEERARRSEQARKMMEEIMRDNDRYLSMFEKRCVTNLARHGHENPLSAGKASKVSQAMCWLINEQHGGKFHENGGELRIGTNWVDFASGNKVIEFYGDYWHANPAIVAPMTIVKFRHKQILADEIWERDAKRLEFIKSKGYEVKIVWESDFRKNPEQVVKECIEWLKK